MNDKGFMRLVAPVNMLIGFCQSADDLTAESNLEQWKARLVYLADDLAKTWDDVVSNISNEYSVDDRK